MKEKNLEDYWKKAKEILHRIEELETEGNEVGFFVSNNTELLKKNFNNKGWRVKYFSYKFTFYFYGFKFKIQ